MLFVLKSIFAFAALLKNFFFSLKHSKKLISTWDSLSICKEQPFIQNIDENMQHKFENFYHVQYFMNREQFFVQKRKFSLIRNIRFAFNIIINQFKHANIQSNIILWRSADRPQYVDQLNSVNRFWKKKKEKWEKN